MMTRAEHKAELIEQKTKTLWAGELELAFVESYHVDLLKEGALEGARMALADARKGVQDPDKIAELDFKVNEIKDAQMKVRRLKETLVDLKAQIEFITKAE